MIAYLEGRIIAQALDGKTCVLYTPGGVGYLVHLPLRVAQSLPVRDEVAAFHVATVVRDDTIDLYGFVTADERETFLICLGIANLGPKTALALLSTYNPDDLRQLVATDNSTLLTRVPGIGKRKAQQIFLELKYKLKISEGGLPLSCVAGTGAGTSFHDALVGMTKLGYSEDEARSVLERIFVAKPDLDVATALRQALKIMAKGY